MTMRIISKIIVGVKLRVIRKGMRTVGWVNLYQKFEIEKYTVCGKLILPKKMESHLFKKKVFGHNWLANLHGFANTCKLPVSNTFKDMQSKM